MGPAYELISMLTGEYVRSAEWEDVWLWQWKLERTSEYPVIWHEGVPCLLRKVTFE